MCETITADSWEEHLQRFMFFYGLDYDVFKNHMVPFLLGETAENCYEELIAASSKSIYFIKDCHGRDHIASSMPHGETIELQRKWDQLVLSFSNLFTSPTTAYPLVFIPIEEGLLFSHFQEKFADFLISSDTQKDDNLFLLGISTIGSLYQEAFDKPPGEKKALFDRIHDFIEQLGFALSSNSQKDNNNSLAEALCNVRDKKTMFSLWEFLDQPSYRHHSKIFALKEHLSKNKSLWNQADLDYLFAIQENGLRRASQLCHFGQGNDTLCAMVFHLGTTTHIDAFFAQENMYLPSIPYMTDLVSSLTDTQQQQQINAAGSKKFPSSWKESLQVSRANSHPNCQHIENPTLTTAIAEKELGNPTGNTPL